MVVSEDEDCAWTDEERERFLSRGYWQKQSLGEALGSWAARYESDTAVVDRSVRLSYRELDAKVSRVAAGLRELGISPGDRVLCQIPNSVAFVVCFFALTRIGALPVLAMPAQREHDIDALCQLARPTAYLVAGRFLGFDYRALAQRIAQKHPGLLPLVVEGGDDPESLLNELEREPGKFASVSAFETALLLLSGGTTGTPKLIPRTHADYLYNARAAAAACELGRSSVYLAALPIAHNFPLACPGLLGTLHAGGRVVLAQTPSCDETFALIERERVTITALVPALLELWLGAREWDETDLSSLRLLQVGGSRLEPDLAKRVEPTLGCRLQQVFGMAEGLICCTRPDDPPGVIVGTQGRPICPDDEVRIVDERGDPVPTGETGELLVRGAYTIRGYYRGGAYNQERFTGDGFYRSGDLARVTSSGNVVVEGRLKEQINRAGEKIAPAEVEAALARHAAVNSCVVVGVPDARLGERSCAFVTSEDSSLDLTTARSFLSDLGLAAYKLPDQLEHIATWALTPVGKVDKHRLVTLARNAASLESTPPSTSTNGSTYREQTVDLRASPADVAALLVQASGAETYAVYERDGEWSVGLESAATLSLSPGGVTLRQAGSEQRWVSEKPWEELGRALSQVSITDHRAYGVCSFELAYALHGTRHLQDCDEALLELFVPRREVRLSAAGARVRCLEHGALSALVELVKECDRRALADAQRTPPTLDVRSAQRTCRSGAEAYREKVQRAVGEIRNKEYLKVILSRKVTLSEPVDLLETYRLGRRHNTPARSFVFKHLDLEMTGFSPETVVRVSPDGCVSTQPLAGTRSTGETVAQEEALRRELVSDVKEIAEHAVSVRLAFEELESICAEGSVAVSRFMTVSRRGSVQHLASRVEGQLAAGFDAWRAFAALFPAVTASGIPKREALLAIRRHEETPRGPYSGCVMIADSGGAIDAALVLRALYRRHGTTWLQAGAGVIEQSRPDREMEETLEKLQCISRYVVRARPAKPPALEAQRV